MAGVLVMPEYKGEPVSRHTVQEIDEMRQTNIAYEYLCHLEEAKNWLEAVLQEELPPATELEENLRNGVLLARLGHYMAPDAVPLLKIYDLDQKRYARAGLQFRHTDNINHWLKTLVVSGLPKTFHPETTDVYDKKGMPKVIYCLHALSSHLYKLGRAPLIQDLYGKVNFTDAEITFMKDELQSHGTPMPLFQKIGHLLSDETDNSASLHEGLTYINTAINEEDKQKVLKGLQNPHVKINHVNSAFVDHYFKMLHEAKLSKKEAILNRSFNECYNSDILDEILTQAEIQGHITSVNVSQSLLEAIEATKKNNGDHLVSILKSPWLGLEGVISENSALYIQELLENLDSCAVDLSVNVKQELLKRVVTEGNAKGNQHLEVAKAMKLVETSLAAGSHRELFTALSTPVLDLNIHEFAVPLYLEELGADLEDNGTVVYEEMKAGLKTLNDIAAVTRAVDTGDPDRTWEALLRPEALFTDIDPAYKVKYWQALTEMRRLKLVEKCPCTMLTYFDVVECVRSVNNNNEKSNQVILALHRLNSAVKNCDELGVVETLQSPALGLADNVSSSDGFLYLKMLQKKEAESEIWLEDVQRVVNFVLAEVREAQTECSAASHINAALQQGDLNFVRHCVQAAGFDLSGQTKEKWGQYYIALKQSKEKKKGQCPWIKHYTKRGNAVFLNVTDGSYSWKQPQHFQCESCYLSKKDIEEVLNVHTDTTVSLEKSIIHLQSCIRGYLVRKTLLRQHKCAVIIQAWWRGVHQRSRYRKMVRSHQQLRKSLEYDNILRRYRGQEDKIIKIQSLWRGRQSRQAFVSLFHETQPSFKVVRQFVSHLNNNSDDYAKEFHLQHLKAQVVQSIRLNQKLADELNVMDIKIGLLVRNRVSLQDVVAHSRNLNELALSVSSAEASAAKGLKSLNKDSRKRLESYQHLFYLLQTSPTYLAKLMFCVPSDRSSRFIKTIIWSLFNFGSTLREAYLLLRLFRSALEEEISAKFTRPAELLTSMPLVLHMVVNYARQSSLQPMIGPLVQKVLDDKNLVIMTDPVDIYQAWRNQQETAHGQASKLPAVVTSQEALTHPEVQRRLANSLQALRMYTSLFLTAITQARSLIPYGLLYIARVLYNTLMQRFPATPEKNVLKIVGNLIYYQFINPAIIAPDSFGVITLPATRSLFNVQRLNLASIAKILQFSASKKGFGEESPHLTCLNGFIIECHRRFKAFFRECCDVEELEEHFSLHQYSEVTLIRHPVIYITLQEICDTHRLLIEYLERIAPDPLDPLCDLLEDMGPVPSLDTLTGCNPNDPALAKLGKTEVCLSLVNKFEVPEEDVTTMSQLFIRAKDMLVRMLPWLHGDSLPAALAAPAGDQQQQFAAAHGQPLASCMANLRACLTHLELSGLVAQEDGYQSLVSAIARDICHRGKYREAVRRELLTLRLTKARLDEKTKFYEEQVALYNQYIQTCLENLNAGKGNVHSRQSPKRHKAKARPVLKYTAARLHEKGVLVAVEELPAAQFKNVQFEISPAEQPGVFTIRGRFMGVDLEKVDISVQDLLQRQFEGACIMDIFGKAKVNVNLLLFLLNKKFYGKS